MPKDSRELKDKLLQIINKAVADDSDLRQSLNIGDKFRFIRERLQALKVEVESALESIKVGDEGSKQVIHEDEQVVYVYLFNAHGMDFQTWLKMLSPSVYYEYSVNRPIYGEKAHVESLIRGKTTRTQHAFMAVAVKKTAILSTPESATKDQLANPVVKIKEGSLRPDRLISFTHNGIDYFMNDAGKLEKIPT